MQPTSWCRVGHTCLTLMPVTRLNAGKKYRFRVFAENVYGRADARDESSLCQTRPSFRKKEARTQLKLTLKLARKFADSWSQGL